MSYSPNFTKNQISFGGSAVATLSASGISMASTNSLTWTVDGGGNIGTGFFSGRPNDVFVKSQIYCGPGGAPFLTGLPGYVQASGHPSQIVYMGVDGSAVPGFGEIGFYNTTVGTIGFSHFPALSKHIDIHNNTFPHWRFDMTTFSVANFLWIYDGTGDLGSPDSGITLNRPRKIFSKENFIGDITTLHQRPGTLLTIGRTTATDNQVGAEIVSTDPASSSELNLGQDFPSNEFGSINYFNSAYPFSGGLVQPNSLAVVSRAGATNGLFLGTKGTAPVTIGANNAQIIVVTPTIVQIGNALNNVSLQWFIDGAGDIGTAGNNRPNNVYAKTLIDTAGTLNLSAATGANILWTTNGGGDIGTAFGSKPNNLYVKSQIFCGIGGPSFGAIPGYISASDHASQRVYMGVDGAAVPGYAEIGFYDGTDFLRFSKPNAAAKYIDIGRGFSPTWRLDMSAGGQNGNFLWIVDGNGNIGAPAANRPDNVYIKTSLFIGATSITAPELGYLTNNEALQSFTLVDNTASPTPVETWVAASFSSIHIEYSVNRGAGIRETGTIKIATDGTLAAIAIAPGATLGSSGVTFSADISGANLRLLYTTSNTGSNAIFKYKVQKWLA